MKKVLLNKYFLATLIFVLLIVISKNNGIIRQINQTKEINQLENQIEYYKNDIENVKKSINALRYDTAHLEKYAREKYFMKRDNEDVFVIIRK
jgi:cell division protein FtsB